MAGYLTRLLVHVKRRCCWSVRANSLIRRGSRQPAALGARGAWLGVPPRTSRPPCWGLTERWECVGLVLAMGQGFSARKLACRSWDMIEGPMLAIWWWGFRGCGGGHGRLALAARPQQLPCLAGCMCPLVARVCMPYLTHVSTHLHRMWLRRAGWQQSPRGLAWALWRDSSRRCVGRRERRCQGACAWGEIDVHACT